jgi:hypothetical protein
MALKGPGIEDNFDLCFYPSGTRKGRKNANMRIFFRGEISKNGQIEPRLISPGFGKVPIRIPSLIRRGGAPSGAAALLARGGVGAVSPHDISATQSGAYGPGISGKVR